MEFSISLTTSDTTPPPTFTTPHPPDYPQSRDSKQTNKQMISGRRLWCGCDGGGGEVLKATTDFIVEKEW